jgi:hypothetical protein
VILRRAAAILGLLVLTAGNVLAAQERNRWMAAGIVGLANVTQSTTLDTTKLSGPVVGLEAGIRFRWAELRGRYSQGNLDQDEGGEGADLVEGELMLGVWPVKPLALRFGPRARSFVTPAGTIRWVFWEARARFEASLSRSASVWSYFEGWYVVSGSVNAAASFDNGRGIEGGLGFQIPSTPLQVRAAYRIDRGALQDDVRTEGVDALMLSIGVGR